MRSRVRAERETLVPGMATEVATSGGIFWVVPKNFGGGFDDVGMAECYYARQSNVEQFKNKALVWVRRLEHF